MRRAPRPRHAPRLAAFAALSAVTLASACHPMAGESVDTSTWGTPDTGSAPACSLAFTAQFSADSAPSWDTCIAQESAASFEFASDASPSPRTLELTLIAANAVEDECSVKLRFPSLCGLGTYTVDAARVGMTFELEDCAAADEFARVYVADAGSASVEALSAGTQTGQLSGIALPLFVQGSFDVSAGNVSMTGNFSTTTNVIAGDAGTTGCVDPE